MQDVTPVSLLSVFLPAGLLGYGLGYGLLGLAGCMASHCGLHSSCILQGTAVLLCTILARLRTMIELSGDLNPSTSSSAIHEGRSSDGMLLTGVCS